MNTETAGQKLNSTVNRFAWLIVLGSALALSTWSLFWIARKYGLPIPLAAIVGLTFDGASIVCADLALKYARTHGDSGFAPRTMVLILASASAYLNSQHAGLAHDPAAAKILFALPPVIAVILFELHSRWIRRGALRRAGRVAQSLPAFGRVTWFLFPVRTVTVVRRIAAHRLATIEHREITGTEPNREIIEPSRQSISGPTSIRVVDTTGAEVPVKSIRYWAKTQGMDVGKRGPIHESILRAYAVNIPEVRLEELAIKSGVNGYNLNGAP